jgi:hypothetical protein
MSDHPHPLALGHILVDHLGQSAPGRDAVPIGRFVLLASLIRPGAIRGETEVGDGLTIRGEAHRRLNYQPNGAFYRIPVQGAVQILVTMVFLTSTQPCDSFR